MTELALNLFHFKITAIPAGFCPFLKENYFPSLKEGCTQKTATTGFFSSPFTFSFLSLKEHNNCSS